VPVDISAALAGVLSRQGQSGPTDPSRNPPMIRQHCFWGVASLER